ncbi:probable isoprenylcysteine alpha-carbonyl methylesterase ICMEL2 isoform X2 [Lycium barbarum]|uniref:probable isoprenylcysteine alpha-carbonyl methylesterase ICMEL2 isoform X2 n=1 Tax=Lycium barbarum TaxID=112863 RepID=UPI00293ED1CE|nr:probable isoprenylcysteine alpha-carbonyl methylesterase ICMEL2 isoform X2 [Lycium barbarum]
MEMENNKGDDKSQLLPRASTVPPIPYTNNNYQRRRKPLSKAKSTPPRLYRQGSFSRDIGHAAAETYLITWLSFKLLSYLGLSMDYKIYGSCLICNATYAWFSPRLDLYLPEKIDSPKPVVAFVTGGAWIIGYKAWGSLLGKQLSEHDIIVACIDYRNFPQGTIGDMVEDVSQGISFVCNTVADYGGDPDRIYLMGQSAGAHIASCALMKQAIKESRGESVSWSTSQMKAYFGLSGGYNLPNLVDHFNNRGLYRSVFLSIMEGEESLPNFSPEIMVQDQSSKAAVQLLPHIILFHGAADSSIPPDSSKTFVDTLNGVGAQAELILYEGKTHTDLFLQDPLRGGKDDLFDHIVAYIHANDKEALAKDAMAPPRKRLVPEILLKLARRVSPF